MPQHKQDILLPPEDYGETETKTIQTLPKLTCRNAGEMQPRVYRAANLSGREADWESTLQRGKGYRKTNQGQQLKSRTEPG